MEKNKVGFKYVLVPNFWFLGLPQEAGWIQQTLNLKSAFTNTLYTTQKKWDVTDDKLFDTAIPTTKTDRISYSLRMLHQIKKLLSTDESRCLKRRRYLHVLTSCLIKCATSGARSWKTNWKARCTFLL